MSLRLRSTRPFAWFALCVFLCGWVVPFFEAHPLGFDDDAACEIPIGRDGAPPQLSAFDESDAAPTHCVLCHLMRALNGSNTAEVAQVAAPAAGSLALAAVNDPLVSLAGSASTSRGPPSLL